MAAPLADAFGRVRVLQSICILCLVGAILQSASVHIAMFLIGRLVTGMGSGMFGTVVPLYQSEVAPPGTRGRMVGCHGAFISAGYMSSAWGGYGCYFANDPQMAWRLLLALQVIGPLLLLVASPKVPESPRWLISRDQFQRAEQVLLQIHASPSRDDTIHSLASAELVQIRQQIEVEKRNSMSFLKMLRTPSYRRRLIIATGTQ